MITEQQVSDVLNPLQDVSLIGIEDGVVKVERKRQCLVYSISHDRVSFNGPYEPEEDAITYSPHDYLSRKGNDPQWLSAISAIVDLIFTQTVEQLQAEVKRLKADKVSLNQLLDERDKRIKYLEQVREIVEDQRNKLINDSFPAQTVGDQIEKLQLNLSKRADIDDDIFECLPELIRSIAFECIHAANRATSEVQG